MRQKVRNAEAIFLTCVQAAIEHTFKHPTAMLPTSDVEAGDVKWRAKEESDAVRCRRVKRYKDKPRCCRTKRLSALHDICHGRHLPPLASPGRKWQK